jgi:NitT/TauT family transport system permease protein
MTKTRYYYHHKAGKLSHSSNRVLLWSIFIVVPILVIAFLATQTSLTQLKNILPQIPFKLLLLASFLTIFRISIAYVFSFVTALALSLLLTINDKVRKTLLPIYDILESVPILAFFPIIILFFIKYNFLEGAAIFVIFVAILWNLVFTMVGGIQLIPQDIRYSAQLYNVKGWKYLRHVLLPAITPEIITGSILAIAAAWDIVIVAEVLHTYIPGDTPALDLLGLGSLFVNASVENNQILFTASLVFMIGIITLTNIFIWQKLLKFSERFRFE